MYTEGIRKIFMDRSMATLEGVKRLAHEAGFHAFVYTGTIYVRDFSADRARKIIPPWIKTCFHINDFQDVQT